MKIRADKFIIAANTKEMEEIQGIAQKYKGYVSGNSDLEKAESVLTIYAMISFDEGYRKGLNELKTEDAYNIVEVKERVETKEGKLKFHYVDDSDLTGLKDVIKRRLKSKRQRNNRSKYCIENELPNEEESFILSMVIHTAFEAGYMKSVSIENMAKELTQDNERAGIIVDLMNEMMGKMNEN